MAHHKSAKTRIRRNETRRVINKDRNSKIKTAMKKVEEAIEAKDAKLAQEALRVAEVEITRGASKGIMHRNTASRKVSRLAKRVKALGGAKVAAKKAPAKKPAAKPAAKKAAAPAKKPAAKKAPAKKPAAKK